MLLKLEQLTIPPGSQLILNNISWQNFEQILEELGEHRSSKLAYQSRWRWFVVDGIGFQK